MAIWVASLGRAPRAAAAACRALTPAVIALSLPGTRPASTFARPPVPTASSSRSTSSAADHAPGPGGGRGAGSGGFTIDMRGKVAFVAGVGDTSGYGWAIAQHLSLSGATVVIGVWPPVMGVLKRSLDRAGAEEKGVVAATYPLDVDYSTQDDIPEDLRKSRRYADFEYFDIKSVAEAVARDYGKVDVLVHAVANGPEVSKPLLETSRKGYLAASSASAYSFLSLLQHFGPSMPHGASALTLSYAAASAAIPGYGGGMSSAKGQLESDVKTLAWEAGRKWGVRVNAISAGPLKTRAAKAIAKMEDGSSFIEKAVDYSAANSPLARSVLASEVGGAALALASPLASAITGEVLRVDCGLHVMGMAPDSKSFDSS